MIISIILGFIAWFFLFLFEVIKTINTKKKKMYSNPYFYIGIIFLLVSYILYFIKTFNDNQFLNMEFKIRIVGGSILSLISLISYIYIIFIALPKGATDGNNNQILINQGIYKKHRHPGVINFIFLSLSLAFLNGSIGFLIFSITNSIINLIYVIFEDLYFFPSYLIGYSEYKKQSFFL